MIFINGYYFTRKIYLSFSGDPNESRTRVSGVRGQRPRPLDDGATYPIE